MDLISVIPYWYWLIAIFWSSFQGFRGIIEHRYNVKNLNMPLFEKIIILYVHDFAFRFICTMAGFFSLYACYYLIKEDYNLVFSVGKSALILLSFIIGIVGIGGQLHFIILMGKLPGKLPIVKS